jgi:glucosamine--fructose-6-phosphate aminotransferase (isomerizing)
MKKIQEYKMLAEIYEQPDVIQKLVIRHIRNNKVFFPEIDGFSDKLKKVKRIIFLGSGTSYHTAIYGNYLAEELIKLPCEAEFADEFIARQAVVESGTAVIILSQSGETADAIKAVKKAKNSHALIIAITNGEKSRLAKIADIVLWTNAGEEEAIAATKSFTSQLLVSALFILYLSQIRRPADMNKKLIKEIILLPSKMAVVLKTAGGIKKLAAGCKKAEGCAVLGEKWNYPIAIEGALKLTETNALEIEGFPTGEFKHGPIAMVKENFPVIFVAPVDSAYKKNREVMQAVKKADGKIILITTAGKKEKMADRLLFIPKAHEIFYPLLSVLPLQLFAFYLAALKDMAVDKPEHLSKFVK